MLELGLLGPSGKMHVVCPEGVWRKGNVDVVCERYAIPRHATLPAGLRAVRGALLRRTGG
ncbi:hypothetical protein [Sorangium sp. So ce1097]|uniref:hypothetical protein n=1 Tax=Sorangium sp. So ce1097 TaxID=3133330 RepID=UPI003F5DDF17